jgi:hypothetical protein
MNLSPLNTNSWWASSVDSGDEPPQKTSKTNNENTGETEKKKKLTKKKDEQTEPTQPNQHNWTPNQNDPQSKWRQGRAVTPSHQQIQVHKYKR